MTELDELKKKIKELEDKLSLLDDNSRGACERNNENIVAVAESVLRIMAKIMPMYKIHKAEEEMALMRLINLPIGRQRYPM